MIKENNTTNRFWYEMLPFVYAIIGAISAASLTETLGKVCGLLLVVAALTIMHLRLRYRQARAEDAEFISANEALDFS